MISDAALVERCRTGDQQAWTDLVERMSRYVYAICVRAYDLGPADADDVFQDVFTRAYKSLDTLQDPGALRPWLGQMTRRLCVDRHRLRRHDALDELPEVAEPDTELGRIEEAMTVRAAMADLSPDCQDVLDRFFARDQSYREIEADTGIAAGTIASRISRCLARLRTLLT